MWYWNEFHVLFFNTKCRVIPESQIARCSDCETIYLGPHWIGRVGYTKSIVWCSYLFLIF